MTDRVGGVPERVGRYEVALQLGQGRTGRVFLARDPSLGRQVAIKALHDDLSLDAAAVADSARLLKEGARTQASLRHPGIVVVHDTGDDERVGAFVVLELMPGGSLRERLAQGRLSRSEVTQLARSLGSALSHAHDSGVIHGNLKPENILVSPWGPKLSDFAGANHAALTHPASVAGTEAPEVLSGHPSRPESDQFSLAAILFEALTGMAPLGGQDASTAAVVVKANQPVPATGVAPDLRSCPRLDAIFERALARDPQARFASCDVFVAALVASLEAAQGPVLTPTSQSSMVPKTARRWQNVAAIVAVGVIFALVLLGRQPRSGGVSLRSVATAFAQALAVTDVAPAGRRATAWSASSSGAPLPFPGPPKTSTREEAGGPSSRPSAAGDHGPSEANDRGSSGAADRGSAGNRDRP
ncbi:MAG TPA: serine/threonine-protein kinase [Polyangiaceae bacterium]|nr:serine/threonine-protein kinase [Polyangiaceae bacterium]